MKKILVTLFLVSSCSNVEVFSLRTFVEMKSKDLKKEALQSFKESKLTNTVPTKEKQNEFFSTLSQSAPYRSYLLLECVQILQKESGLLIDEPIYASASKWNSFENYFESIFSFYTLVDNIPKEVNMECDVAVNDKKEVDKYRVRNYSLSLIKKD